MSDKPDRILDKYLTRKPDAPTGEHAKGEPAQPASSGGAGGEDATDDLGCFGYFRGVRDRAIMLELRKKDGTIAAFSYAYLERADFDPSEGITLHIMGKRIQIKGQNLNGEARPNIRLFHGITRHRVPWVQEGRDDAPASADQKHAPSVSAVLW